MSHLINVYSPTGEVFENSPVNARDLVVNAGWTYHDPKYVPSEEVKAEVEAIFTPQSEPEPEIAPEPVIETIASNEPLPIVEAVIEPEKIEEKADGEFKVEDGTNTEVQSDSSTDAEQGSDDSEDETFTTEENGEVKVSRGRPRKSKE